MHPFDVNDALLAKHAQHVVLIHFPIALFMVSVAFDFVAHWTKRQHARRGGLLQFSRSCTFNAPGRRDRPACLAISARGAKAQGDTAATSGPRSCLQCDDLPESGMCTSDRAARPVKRCHPIACR